MLSDHTVDRIILCLKKLLAESKAGSEFSTLMETLSALKSHQLD
ncbi:hypothetical protein C8D97_10670 [Pleionea mediterranea]|uniref:Uncharacterized protein n=1 Tax=Pleionea mediterranea TaxID=523701 RepID=A0A316FR45_9GAMM|nr:hypothetical protein C8D97_10670 [Pleionea mediterranea]